MKGGMALVTFNPGGVINVKINRFSPREMLLFQVKGDRATVQHTMHLQSKLTSSMACALGSNCIGSALSAIRLLKIKEKRNILLTKINAGTMTPVQMNIPIIWSNKTPRSIVKLEKRSMLLENQTRSTP